jgi:PilZ domain
MPCQLLVESRWHSGLVLDLSPSGLFIQTHAKTREGQRVDLSVSREEGEPMPLVVEVVRKKVVPPRLVTVAQGGVGVRILSAPEDYYRYLEGLGIAATTPPRQRSPVRGAATEVEAEPEALPRFRVRVSQTSGPRSRRVEISAADADAARDLALEEIGDGWKVLDVEAL